MRSPAQRSCPVAPGRIARRSDGGRNHAEGGHLRANELKHGPIALTGEAMAAMAPRGAAFEKMLSKMQ